MSFTIENHSSNGVTSSASATTPAAITGPFVDATSGFELPGYEGPASGLPVPTDVYYVSFVPTAVGTFQGTITFKYNFSYDSYTYQQVFNLSGEGTPVPPPPPPADFDFKNMKVGTIATLDKTWTNDACLPHGKWNCRKRHVDFYVSWFPPDLNHLSPPDQGPFNLSYGTKWSLRPGERQKFAVAARPTSPGSYTATLYAFNVWRGSITDQSTYSVSMRAIQTTFPAPAPSPTSSLTVSTMGRGTVSGPGIYCPTLCQKAYPNDIGAVVTLSGTADPGWKFSRWDGACAGYETQPACTLEMSAAKSATATFEPLPASMAVARYQHTATALASGKVLVAGGSPSSLYDTASAELYDPATNTWTAAGSMAMTRRSHTATLLANGKVLVAGGFNKASGYATASAELYDPATNRWSLAASMTTARANYGATRLADGRVLVIGGFTGSSATASAELYDPASNTWSPAASMTTPRYGHTATLLADGHVLVTGGNSGSGILASAEWYDPVSNIWSSAGSMISNYDGPATLLPSGKVLVAGGFGFSGEGSNATAELYDPVSNKWSLAADMTSARKNLTATLLHNGIVLVIGGDQASAELYDPATNAWSITASLNPPRSEHVATLLVDGNVLITGGLIGSSGPAASSELYIVGSSATA